MRESYKIWFLEYAMADSAVSAMVYGRHNEGYMYVPFGFLVLQGNGHTVALDCGHLREGHALKLEAMNHVRNVQSLEETLARIGLRGEDFDTVILTHAHWDHMGGIRAFPNAHFYLQKKEMLDWVEVFSLPSVFDYIRAGINPDDMRDALDMVLKGRMTLLDGFVCDLLPGISVVPAFNTHTYGSQFITIQVSPEDPADMWVFTGDACGSLESFGKDGKGPFFPLGYGVGSNTNMVFALKSMYEKAQGRLDRIIVTHEPALWKMFKTKVESCGLHTAVIQA
ncbi:MBL fold metallo-hydrolase [Treponema parvum]|uniref:MBL fold metallo-hydrolase n=1 Tax=Treponema parvum TaxID=138851 RepID=A0A975F2U7_9SPIR|nr:MBL fold metallo-hydrolase [Treponema parvum]QTQ13610.1 MBL fold metallo-hydrolase [Treponema parvum]